MYPDLSHMDTSSALTRRRKRATSAGSESLPDNPILLIYYSFFLDARRVELPEVFKLAFNCSINELVSLGGGALSFFGEATFPFAFCLINLRCCSVYSSLYLEISKGSSSCSISVVAIFSSPAVVFMLAGGML